FFRMVILWFWTDTGRSGIASCTRFCTMTRAVLRSVPTSNVTNSVYVPVLPESDVMYSMPGTPLTCCSIGAATVSATTWALAPGYEMEMETPGGVIRGYCATGRL